MKELICKVRKEGSVKFTEGKRENCKREANKLIDAAAKKGYTFALEVNCMGYIVIDLDD